MDGRLGRRGVLAMAAAAASASLFTGTAEANDPKLTRTAFRYSGKRYFRANAESIRLGSFGEKKTPLTQANYLAVDNNISSANLAKVSVNVAGPFNMTWTNATTAQLGGSTKFLKMGGAKGTLTREAATSADLKLVKIFMNEGPLRTLLNQHAGAARNFLSQAGGSGRVVSEVWVVMEAALASQVSTNVSVTANGTANGGIELAYGSSSTSRLALPPDATFAYLLHKVKSWSNGRTVVSDLEDDQHGPF